MLDVHCVLPLLFPLVGIDDDGDGAVVDKADLHVRAELAVLDVPESLTVHLLDEFVVADAASSPLAAWDEAGALALGRFAVEREVGDDERRVAQLDRCGSACRFVLKNAQVGTPASLGTMAMSIARQQNDQAGADGAGFPRR